jgi:hypothetical protein
MRAHAIRVAALLAFVAGLVTAAVPPSTIVGRWHSTENSDAGFASVFEFRDGGAFDYSPANVVETTYRIEGDGLFLPSETKGGPEHRQTIDWMDEDRVRLSAPGTLSLFLDRKAGSGPKKSMVGEWIGPRDVGGRTAQATYLFRPDGRLLLVMTLLTSQGQYSLDGDKIRMGVNGKWSAEGTYRIDGDTLTLSIAGTKGPKDSKYARY